MSDVYDRSPDSYDNPAIAIESVGLTVGASERMRVGLCATLGCRSHKYRGSSFCKSCAGIVEPKIKIEAGLDTDDIHVWEQLDFVKLADGSRLWLVEDKKTGEAELLRTCDIFKGREGVSRTKNEGFTTEHNRTLEQSAEGRLVYDKLLIDAQTRLTDLKTGRANDDWFVFPEPVSEPEVKTIFVPKWSGWNPDAPTAAQYAKQFPEFTQSEPDQFWVNFLTDIQRYAPISSGAAEQIAGHRGLHVGFRKLVAAHSTPPNHTAPLIAEALEKTAAEFLLLAKVLRAHGAK
jgi:hypothetical protein